MTFLMSERATPSELTSVPFFPVVKNVKLYNLSNSFFSFWLFHLVILGVSKEIAYLEPQLAALEGPVEGIQPVFPKAS